MVLLSIQGSVTRLLEACRNKKNYVFYMLNNKIIVKETPNYKSERNPLKTKLALEVLIKPGSPILNKVHTINYLSLIHI